MELDHAAPEHRPASWRAPLTLAVPAGTYMTVVTTPTLASSLFRMALGFDSVVGGIRVLGLEPHGLDRQSLRAFRRRVGSSLLPDGLLANVSLRTNLMVLLIYGDGLSRADADARAEETLARFGLADWTDLRPSDLPPDTRQVAALARAVVARPELLLLHDPVTSVSHAEAVRLLTLCREYAPTVLAAVHGEDEAVCAVADACSTWDGQECREMASA